MGAIQRDSGEFVQSLERGLAVIQAFGPEHPAMTLSEVARQTGMTRAAARRFLLTLQALGHVASDGRNFTLRPHVLNLGYAYLSSMGWLQVAQSLMEEFVREAGESCSASVLDGADVVYVARVPTSRIMTTNLSIGTRLPAFATSMGRVLLSYLSAGELDDFFETAALTRFTERTVTDEAALRRLIAQSRQQGYCLVDQELETGLRSVAVPVLDRQGRALAAINVSTHAGRVKKAELAERLLPLLKATSARITANLPR